MFSNILLAADGSAPSHRSADTAIEISAAPMNININILYVVDENKSKSDVLRFGDHQDVHKERQRMLCVYKDKFKKAGIYSSITILHGNPADSIIQYANSRSFDCLILSSRGRSQVQTMLLGSVSHKVMKYVRIPILLIK